MIRLGMAREPRWLDLGAGVRVLARPMTTAIYKAAELTALRHATEIAERDGLIERAGGGIWGIPDPSDRDGMLGLKAQFMLQALAAHAIAEWQGVGGPDGLPVPVTTDNVAALIREFPLQAATFESLYLSDLAATVAEGNGSGAAPSGTSAAAPATADGAGTTASPAPTADAPPAAGSAPTTSTPPAA